MPGWIAPQFLQVRAFCVGVERVVERRQVLHQMLHLDFDPMDQVAALEAVPVEGVELVRPRRFDDETDRAFLRPLRRMRRVRRQQEHFALADRHVVEFAVVADLQHHVALELVEELFHRIVVIVGALVRPADDLHGHLAVLEHLLVADRRLQQVLVLADPFLEVEGAEPSGRHRSLRNPTRLTNERSAASTRSSRTRAVSRPSRPRSAPATAVARRRRPARAAPASISNARGIFPPAACA